MNLGKRHQLERRKANHTNQLDWLVYVVAIAAMAITLDQVRIIWIDHNASGVSLPTWGFYTFASSVWCLYGYVHKDNVIFLTSALWILIEALVAIGVIVYGT